MDAQPRHGIVRTRRRCTEWDRRVSRGPLASMTLEVINKRLKGEGARQQWEVVVQRPQQRVPGTLRHLHVQGAEKDE